MIERQVRERAAKRQVDDIIEKNKKIGELLGVEKVPLHVLAWKEPRLELGEGDCYPVVDVLEKIAELFDVKQSIDVVEKKKPGRPKVDK